MKNSVETQAIRKIIIRLVPYMFMAYLVAFLDRVSVTYASMGGMDKALGLTSSTFGLISGIFFISYFFCEIPSNLLLKRFGARKWIARILVTWGLVTAFTACVNSAWKSCCFSMSSRYCGSWFFPRNDFVYYVLVSGKRTCEGYCTIYDSSTNCKCVGCSSWNVDSSKC